MVRLWLWMRKEFPDFSCFKNGRSAQLLRSAFARDALEAFNGSVETGEMTGFKDDGLRAD
jgi:hypothetical protein